MSTIQEMIQVKPSARQLAYQEMEFIGFTHFGINTFYDNDWGDGTESPKKFNPTKLDCKQWVDALKSAGMTGVILTCKHHDGFCLWPSKYTNHSVKNSPWKNGQGDVVKEFSDACKEADLKFGVYLSPWDRSEPTYGSGKAYDDYFVHQLEELLTQYGDVFEVWFDGANGEGPNGKVQIYDWPRYYATIRRLQPEAVIAICGPDVRWVGNEAGKSRENEWSVVPIEYSHSEYTAELSQQEDNTTFRESFDTMDEDLGSTEKLKQYQGQLIWYPAEVDTSIRPSWFYHAKEDANVKSVDTLFNIYKTSVGGNATLLLNVPPNKEGRIAEADVRVLTALGQRINQMKTQKNMHLADVQVSSSENNQVTIHNQLDIDIKDTYWTFDVKDSMPTLVFNHQQPLEINTVRLSEYLLESQRVESFTIKAYKDEKELLNKQSGVIGYQKIIEFDKVTVDKIVIEFTKFRGDRIYINGVEYF